MKTATRPETRRPHVWVKPDDVDGMIAEGAVLRTTKPISDFCLRRDDDAAPVPQGALVVITDTTTHSAMAVEIDMELGAAMVAALDLQADGLFEVRMEMTPDGDAEERLRQTTVIDAQTSNDRPADLDPFDEISANGGLHCLPCADRGEAREATWDDTYCDACFEQVQNGGERHPEDPSFIKWD